mgnify:CR=1 FL=1
MLTDVLVFEAVYLASNFGFTKFFDAKPYDHLKWNELTTLGSIAVFTIFVISVFFVLVKATQHRLSEQR